MVIGLSLIPSMAVSEEQARRYRTLEERRDAGKKHEITDWLYVSPLIEFEYLSQTLRPYDLQGVNLEERSKTLQLEIELLAAEWLKAEIVYEYDDELDEFVLDEAMAEYEAGDFKLEVGKLYLPFGEYYSRFATGPLLEFGETRGRSLVLAYEPNDELEAAIFIFKSKIDKRNIANDHLDWGVAVNMSPLENVSAGFSYVSDLSESDESVLQDNLFYEKRVDGISAYISVEFDEFETSIEWLQALNAFAELDADRNQPRAWNLEVALYPDDNFEWALRLEGSKELEDGAELQAGLAATLHAAKNITLTMEILRGRFKRGLAEDDNGNELDTQNQFAVQLGISF